ncbi:MAG TPA: ROK family protein [Acidiferrobacterales bacterium]|nr:ROK family protein [Acidiferrobacterales bacterium]
MLRIGIDLGGTKTEGIVMDDTNRILIRERRPTPNRDYEAVLNTMQDLVLSLEQQAGAACRVGIGTPGALSTRTGNLKNANTTCLNGKPILADLEKRLKRRIRLSNDANCFALSEAIDGAGQGYPVIFGVIMGTGVGGGIVFNGQVHQGPQWIAGEWGHNVLEADGPLCYCGKRGCVETLISGPGLARDYQTMGGDPQLEAHAIAERAAEGSAIAEAAMQRLLDRFGRALAMVINILDPDAIVLGGGLSNVTRLYTEGRERTAKYVFNDELLTPILPNKFGDSSGVRGAAQLWRVGNIVD